MASKWADLAATIEQQITDGELAPGAELPSESDLMRAGLSRTTVRTALGSLESRGLIEGSAGTRRRVVDRTLLTVHVTRPQSRVANHQSPTPGADSWAHDVADLGHVPGTELWVRTHQDREASHRLGVPPDTVLVTREQIRSVDGRPHNLARWNFPASLARATKLAAPDDIPEGSIPYLSGIGHRPVMFVVEIEARMPTSLERGVLGMRDGVPLLIETRTGSTHTQAVFVSETLWPGDRARLILEM